jgi:hypothetical protein
LIDLETFSAALGAGEFDVCLDLLKDCKNGRGELVVLNCRLAEALFHSGRRDEALECGRRAFALAPNGRDTAHFCAWLFSTRT